MEPLDEAELAGVLEELSLWELRDGALHRVFRFPNFRAAIGFIVRLAFEAEQRNHHPELLNVYDRVELSLRTHDAGNRVTALDVELAVVADRLAADDWRDRVQP